MLKSEFSGRLGNLLLINVGLSILSKKYDLKTNYQYLEYFESLGFQPYHGGQRVMSNFLMFGDERFNSGSLPIENSIIDLLEFEEINFGIDYRGNFQNGQFLQMFRDEILSLFNLNYDDSYKNDVYIHIRLDDMTHVNPGLSYYRKCIENTSHDRIFLSTDSPNHEIIKSLSEEFPIIYYNDSPINTINFAKNFGNLILSKGTFSWWIGFLSKANQIFYPTGFPEHPKIFIFDEWTPMDR